MKLSKAQRARNALRNYKDKAGMQTAMVAGVGLGWWGASYIGSRIATDEKEGNEATIELVGRELPKYEVYLGGAALAVAWAVKDATYKLGGLLAISGALGGAAGVRGYKAELAA